jgi:ABC-2 type transport system ATP-binding protein
LIEELGEYIVEIEAPQPQLLAQALYTRLGSSTIEDNVVSFRFDGNARFLADLHADLGPQVRAMRWRRPNLNDVFLRVQRGDHGRSSPASRAPRRDSQ